MSKLETMIDPARYAADLAPRVIVLDMVQLISLDTSGLETLDALRRQLAKRGGALVLAGANEQPMSLLRRSGFMERVGAANVLPDLRVATLRARALAASAGKAA